MSARCEGSRTLPADDGLLPRYHYWPIGVAEAMRVGQDRYAFARVGKTITVTDALIAAVAREHQAVLVTNNLKDYPMPDVQLLALDGRER